MKKLLSTVLIITFIFGFITFVSKEVDKQNTLQGTYNIKEIVISSGETLWSLGQRYCSDKDDIRLWIYEVKELNNCDSNLVAGQTIEIYCEVE